MTGSGPFRAVVRRWDGVGEQGEVGVSGVRRLLAATPCPRSDEARQLTHRRHIDTCRVNAAACRC
ncbi:hypothetical protein [Frankia sp. AgB32]|uniref:hypothetical protein n=1 Tax=Frankia sp. AgB32 TaxID=631119 RepID=UPI00200DCC35|nr:hypothetical protein [Frankia sp. AgB32]MCK9897608.1 hypothetical protein [Frankia sp. AgB32]